jgi:LEA14-like dessication related protein
MKRRALIATALLAVLLLGGCTGMGLKPPAVSVAGIEVIEAGLFEQRLAIKLRVVNPNNVEIPIGGLSFEVELNGEPFATGVSDKAIKVPRMGEAMLNVTAVTGLAGIVRQIEILTRGNVDAITYRIKGRLMTGPSIGLNFDEKGRLEMPKAGQGRGKGPDPVAR